MEMNPNIGQHSPRLRRVWNERLGKFVRTQDYPRLVSEEMKLSREVQADYNQVPFGDERDQLEFEFEQPVCNRDFADECDCPNCSV